MNVIFTDVDGVLNSNLPFKTDWNPTAIDIYNRLCREFDLKPVISSTWRTNHTIKELQRIFDYWGIETPIYDYTPILYNEPRGVEIDTWLRENWCSKWVVIDDNVSGITPYVLNVVKCTGSIGLTEEDYITISNILRK